MEKETIAYKAEHSLVTKYKFTLWRMFTKAIKMYDMIKEGDKICVCISGGKDSMLLALLFKHLVKYSDFPFTVKYMVMNPGYEEKNIDLIKDNLKKLEIDATIVDTDIFDIANNASKKPCYLCAKMRRGALYRIAKQMGCNKIALGHHYDDVMITTLMNMLNSGSFQTMLPKLHSDNYKDMELIRPMYFIREKDIISFKDYMSLSFLNCACKFTSESSRNEVNSQRVKTKKLIEQLLKDYSPVVEKNIFKSASNVHLDMILGYKADGKEISFMDNYEEMGEKINEKIEREDLENKAIEKAIREHKEINIEEK